MKSLEVPAFALVLNLILVGGLEGNSQGSGALVCPPLGQSVESLLALRESGFEMSNDDDRNQLAIGLLDCVGHPDPAIRDGVVYGGYANWLRSGALWDETRLILLDGLLGQLVGEEDDEGFRRPFAALDLSEVARTDRIEPWLTPDLRGRLVQVAATYLAGINDYRGFSDLDGWRHGVAHGSDLALQLVLNPEVGKSGLLRLLDAVATQVAPEGEVFYTYGEPERLARPVTFAWRRKLLNEADWAAWFRKWDSPAPFAAWSDVFNGNAGLAKRHNTLAFLAALHLSATAGSQPDSELAALVEISLGRVLGN